MDPLRTYLASLPRGGKADLARRLGINPSFLGQIQTGIRPAPVELLWKIERETAGAVTRKSMRPEDWRDIWPELSKKSA